MARLQEFGERYRRERQELERREEALRRERDREIKLAADAGIPVREIAHALGLTHQRVSGSLRGD